MATELKSLPDDCTEFTANGVKYLIKPSLSVERFKWYEKYQINFGYGRTFESISKTLEKAVDLANKGKGLESWNLIFNLKESVGKDLDKRSHQAFYLCALFMVTEDEDLTAWDEQLAEKKIKDWSAEGLDAMSFFRLSSNLVSGFLNDLEAISQNISEIDEVLQPLKDLQTDTEE